MTVENELKKEYLKRYEKAVRQMEKYEEKIMQIRDSRISISVVADGMPKGSSISDLSSYAAILDKAESAYIRARYKRAVLGTEIGSRINALENEDERKVLRYRYLHLLDFEKIATKMDKSYRHALRIHGNALSHFSIDNVT